MKIGDLIKLYRLKCKLTQNELAVRANMSRSYLADIENNRYNPSLNILESIADALDIKISTLLGDKSEYEYLSSKENIDDYNAISKEKTDIRSIPIIRTAKITNPILSVENIKGYLPTLNKFLKDDKNYFYLVIDDNSMNLEFQKGSLLLIEKNDCIENGKIGAVQIKDMDITIKKIIKKNNLITLIPMSTDPSFIPHMYEIKNDEIRIIGIVKQAIKSY